MEFSSGRHGACVKSQSNADVATFSFLRRTHGLSIDIFSVVSDSHPVDMTLEDPFYVVKDEVFRALNKTRGLYVRWAEAGDSEANGASDAELRNALRSIDWDLEDLEDTIGIVEKNSTKFKIDKQEINERRSFIEATKQEVQAMRCKVAACGGGRRVGSAGYARLASGDGDSPARRAQPLAHHHQSNRTSSHLDDNTLTTCDMPAMTAVLPGEEHTPYASCTLPHRNTSLSSRLLRERRHWIAIGILSTMLGTIILLFIVL